MKIKNKYIIFTFILLVFTHLYYRITFEFDKQITGDGAEYVLTTEAFINHRSADIRAMDIESFQKNYSRFYNIENLRYKEVLDDIKKFVNNKNKIPFHNEIGFWADKNKDVRIIHFCAYSLL